MELPSDRTMKSLMRAHPLSNSAAAGAMPEDEAHRLALAVHEKILAAIEAGDGPRAAHIARAHLDAVQAFTLSGHQDRTVNANLVR